MKLSIRIGRIDEHVRVDHEHLASSFHRIVKRVALRDINQMATAPKGWQWQQLLLSLSLVGVKEKPQRGFHQFRHGPILARCFLAQARHNGVIDIQGRFQMDNYVADMGYIVKLELGRQARQKYAHVKARGSS